MEKFEGKIGERSYVWCRRRGQRFIRLSFGIDGSLRLSSGYSVSQASLERLIISKEDWIRAKLKEFSGDVRERLPARREDYLTHREEARLFIAQRLHYFSSEYGFQYGRVSVRNQASRWGSCSRKGNLNFSFKLLFLPPELADYVIVHELCHLRELNHSLAFWSLLGSIVPDWRSRRRCLRSFC